MPPILSKDSANRAKYKIKKDFFLCFYFRDAAYLIQRYIFYFISPKKITDFIESQLVGGTHALPYYYAKEPPQDATAQKIMEFFERIILQSSFLRNGLYALQEP